jgi:hypothetical protein
MWQVGYKECDVFTAALSAETRVELDRVLEGFGFHPTGREMMG